MPRPFPVEFRTELLLAGQHQLVLCGEQVFVTVQNGVAYDGSVFASTEDDAYCGIFLWTAPQVVIPNRCIKKVPKFWYFLLSS